MNQFLVINIAVCFGICVYLSYRLWKTEQKLNKLDDEFSSFVKESRRMMENTAKLVIGIDDWREQVTAQAKTRAEQRLTGREIRRG